MKDIHEIIEGFCGDIIKDSASMAECINEETKTEEEFFEKLEVAKLLKKYCEQDIQIFGKYRDILVKTDISFFEYYTKKLNFLISQKKY